MNYYLNALKKYAVFSGRAQRAEFWYFHLFTILIGIVLRIISWLVKDPIIFSGYHSLGLIYTLATIIPMISVEIRRFHDIGKSGWWIFISLIPLVGPIWAIVLMMFDSQPGANKYGPNPKEKQQDAMSVL